jgi:hypothetical protein
MIDVESVEFTVGRQIDPQPALSMNDNFGCIKHGLFARHGPEPIYL